MCPHVLVSYCSPCCLLLWMLVLHIRSIIKWEWRIRKLTTLLSNINIIYSDFEYTKTTKQIFLQRNPMIIVLIKVKFIQQLICLYSYYMHIKYYWLNSLDFDRKTWLSTIFVWRQYSACYIIITKDKTLFKCESETQ